MTTLPPHVLKALRDARARDQRHLLPLSFESPFDSTEQAIKRLRLAYVEGRVELEIFEARLDELLGLTSPEESATLST